ncbi:uncharacterized protein LOC132184376 isoform X2 [Corylus avellana]|uniref:uncharacterized protein LOC132184376 isoform X2 n=1 Tax=Corylus avellana TaxID=13451 RepID=UPI00286B0860|nr:uncharacterized protein LOC132184376 isoform X2 [Corylus avellana]
MTIVTTTYQALLCNNHSFFGSKPSLSLSHSQFPNPRHSQASSNAKTWPATTPPPLISNHVRTPACHAARRKPTIAATPSTEEGDDNSRRVLQIILWVAEGVYILWLFLLPYAPGDPVWAISSDTIHSLVGLSLNFFFILPLMNSAFLIPYMAIRLNEADADCTLTKRSQLGSVMTNGAPIVGLIGGGICLISALWALFGRMESNFGSIGDRWEFLVSYLGSERLAYAFIWDICFYTIFQPWLIGDNLQNVQKSKAGIVNYLRFVPVVGLISYLLCLNLDDEF